MLQELSCPPLICQTPGCQPQRCPYQKSSHAKSHVSVIGRNSRVARSIPMLSREIYLEIYALLCSPIVHPAMPLQSYTRKSELKEPPLKVQCPYAWS